MENKTPGASGLADSGRGRFLQAEFFFGNLMI